MRLLQLHLAYCLYLVGLASSQSLLSADTDAFINKVLTDWNTAGGAAVAVVRRNSQGAWEVETKGYGTASSDGTKVTEQTLFPLGSNSKVCSAQLLQEMSIQTVIVI